LRGRNLPSGTIGAICRLGEWKKQMMRHVFNALAAVSFAVCLSLIVLWVRSCWIYDAYNWQRPGTRSLCDFSLLVSRSGILIFEREDRDRPPWPPTRGYFQYWDGTKEVSGPNEPREVRRIDWGGEAMGLHITDKRIVVVVPDVVLILFAVLLPVIWYLYRRRRRAGHSSTDRSSQLSQTSGEEIREAGQA
jgi:hypothetical protein